MIEEGEEEAEASETSRKSDGGALLQGRGSLGVVGGVGGSPPHKLQRQGES